MYTDNGKKTIYDDVKPRKMVSVDIPEFNEIKTDNHFKMKNISLDNDLETYNTTSFPKFDIVQDNELFNLWGFGDVEMMSLNPEYKFKYPKLTKSEFMKQEWQTQQGVPNKLNQFLRAEEAGTSIQDIKAQDNDYEEGLLQLYTTIDKEAENIQTALNSDGKNDVILTEAQKDHLKEAERKLKEDHKKLRHIAKRYNPVHIKPALANKEQYQKKVEREMNLLRSLQNDPVYLKNVKEPKPNSSELQKALLQKEIKDGKLLNPTPKQPPKQPSTDLTPEQIEQNKDAFKKAIAEGKQNLKNKKAEKYDEEKSNRYENLEKEYKEESRKQVAHENLVLKGYDEVISKLEGLSTKKLSNTEREEINDMLKKIDGTNIGAINQVESAIKRLKSKQSKIEEHKNKILDKLQKQEAERKAPRRVSRSSNIMQVSDLPINDDESDFSVKKKIKSRPHFSGLGKNKT
jgi:hypothetical protein